MKKFLEMTDVKQQEKNLKIVVGLYKKVTRLKIITKKAIAE
jgi:hypothetical protein